MNKAMRKYYIGMFVLGVVTCIIAIFLLLQGASAKQDVATERKAQEIAEKLESYVNRKQEIPESLEAAGIRDVPNTVSYDKKSESQYEFCVTYKTEKELGLLGGPLRVLTGGIPFGYMGGAPYGQDGLYSDSYEAPSLYVPPYHKKGKNCQKVKPYLYNDRNFNFDDFDSPSFQQPNVEEFCAGAENEGACRNIFDEEQSNNFLTN